MAVKKGCKQTEVGVIPKDWGVKPLQSFIAALEAGVSVKSTDSLTMLFHGKYILKTSCISGGVFYPQESKVIILKDLNRVKLNPRKNSVVISRMNTPELVGEVGFIDSNYENLFLPDRLWQTKYKDASSINGRWLSYVLSYQYFARKIKDTATGTSNSMKNISKDNFLSIIIPKPTKAEQTAIAHALSDMDALIQSLATLIQKKRLIKQGAMQKLLNPYDKHGVLKDGWVVKKLGEVAILKNGYAFKSISYTKIGTLKVVTITNVQDGYMILKGCNKIINVPLDLQNHQLLKINDLLISMTGNVGRICRVSENNCLLNQRVGKIIPFSIENNFLFCLLSQRKFILEMQERATGGAQGNLHKASIANYKITIPISYNKQTHIATILSGMDSEITALESKLNKAKDMKQGMMQNLLTGHIRLVQPKASGC